MSSLPALTALLPAIEQAQHQFDNEMHDGVAPAAAYRAYNSVLENAFHALSLDTSAVNHAERLRAIWRPSGERSLWFHSQDPSQTFHFLQNVAKTGQIVLDARHPRDNSPSVTANVTDSHTITDERLFWRLDKSLRAGAVISIGDIQVRHVERGAEWEDGEDVITALNQGIYLRLPVYRGAPDGHPVGHRWLHYGHLDDLPSVIKPYTDTMSADDRSALMQSMVFEAAMKQILPERHLSSQRSPARV